MLSIWNHISLDPSSIIHHPSSINHPSIIHQSSLNHLSTITKCYSRLFYHAAEEAVTATSADHDNNPITAMKQIHSFSGRFDILDPNQSRPRIFLSSPKAKSCRRLTLDKKSQSFFSTRVLWNFRQSAVKLLFTQHSETARNKWRTSCEELEPQLLDVREPMSLFLSELIEQEWAITVVAT